MSQAPPWIVKLSIGIVVTMVLVVGVLFWLARAASVCDGRPPAAQTFEREASEQQVRLRGTVLDAESSEPLSDVEVVAPDGTRTRSDSAGRFEFVDLPEDLSGPLTATAKDGATAENRLRPLRPGVLEVVLRLRSP